MPGCTIHVQQNVSGHLQTRFYRYMYLHALTGGHVIEREDGSGDVLHIGLGDLLSFVTRADYPPPLGFSVSLQSS